MNYHASAAWASVGAEGDQAKQKVLASGKLTYWDGHEGRDFEREFARFADCEYALGVCDFDTALELALVGLGIGHIQGSRDEVVVSGLASPALLAGIVRRGAVPVLADIDRDTRNMTALSLAERLTPQTKALVVTHEVGLPCEMDSLTALAETHGIAVIEECSQAFGALYKGRSVGSFGHVACWGIHPDGFMTTGTEGGAMLTTRDPQQHERMASYKDQGKRWSQVAETGGLDGGRWKPDSSEPDWRLTEVQAAVARTQLNAVPGWRVVRQCQAERLWQAARACTALRVPLIPAYMVHAAAMATVFVEPGRLRAGWDRDRVLAEINARGVVCFSGSDLEVPRDGAFREVPWRPGAPLPVARELIETSLMFLCHPALTEAEVDRSCQVIGEVMNECTERRETHYRLLHKPDGEVNPQTTDPTLFSTSDNGQE